MYISRIKQVIIYEARISNTCSIIHAHFTIDSTVKNHKPLISSKASIPLPLVSLQYCSSTRDTSHWVLFLFFFRSLSRNTQKSFSSRKKERKKSRVDICVCTIYIILLQLSRRHAHYCLYCIREETTAPRKESSKKNSHSFSLSLSISRTVVATIGLVRRCEPAGFVARPIYAPPLCIPRGVCVYIPAACFFLCIL